MANFFNKNLKNIRLEKKMSQQKLADLVKVNRANISRWENGEVEIPLDAAYNLSKVLNVDFIDMVSKDLIEDGSLRDYLDNKTNTLVKEIQSNPNISNKGKEMLLNTLNYVKEDTNDNKENSN